MADHGDSRLLVAYLRPHRRRVFALVAILVAAMLLPVAGPVLVGRFADDALNGQPVSQLTLIAIVFLVITLTADGLQLLVTWLSVRLAWEIGNQLRGDLARKATSLELAWHGEHSPGLLIERIDGDIDAINKFSSTAVLQLLGNAVLLSGVLVVALFVDWRAGLLIGVATVVASVLLVTLRSVGVPAHDHEREVLSHLYGDLEERLGGLEDLRANGAGRYAVHRLHDHSSRWWHAARRAALLGDSSYVAAGVVFSLGSAATLGLGVWLLRQGELSEGSVLVLFRFSQMIREPLERIAEQMREFRKAAAGARRAARMLATQPRIVDGAGAALPAGPLSVELDHVELIYDDEEDEGDEAHPVLHDIDLRIAPGTVLGVLGRTGSGKTSLGRLLLRFWDPTGGTVRLGDVDLRDTTAAELRRRVGVVTQEVELLRASLRDNLTLFDAWPASDERLTEVLGDVGLSAWVAALPDGLDTPLAGSDALSAGEAQLLAFARVLLADPGLVLLDEASSRLDPATEARVIAATERLLAGRTVVIIAHRLATLDRADQILVMDHGRVVELGDREALAADPDSRYTHLLRASAAAQAEVA
jgi:ABC-type multidrug transport system fused ATPase/permease subunit